MLMLPLQLVPKTTPRFQRTMSPRTDSSQQKARFFPHVIPPILRRKKTQNHKPDRERETLTLLPFHAWYTRRGGASSSMIRRLESESCAFPCILPSTAPPPPTLTDSTEASSSSPKQPHCAHEPPGTKIPKPPSPTARKNTEGRFSRIPARQGRRLESNGSARSENGESMLGCGERGTRRGLLGGNRR